MVGDHAARPTPLLHWRHQRAGQYAGPRRGGGPGPGSGHLSPRGYLCTGSTTAQNGMIRTAVYNNKIIGT